MTVSSLIGLKVKYHSPVMGMMKDGTITAITSRCARVMDRDHVQDWILWEEIEY